VAMLALDEFVLWVNAKAPYKSAKEYVDAMKAGQPNQFKMGGTGSKQEDQIITAAIEQTTGVKMTYVPYKGGGDVAAQLVGGHVDSSVNNPIEAVAQWRAGELRALCVFDAQRIPLKEKVTSDMAWGDIPTCKEQGLDIEYLMLRGIFMTPGATPDQVAFYVDLMRKVQAAPEWKEYIERTSQTDTFLTGAEFQKFIDEDIERVRKVASEEGWLVSN
jgi:putative tricarboxylic transport membrane protein